MTGVFHNQISSTNREHHAISRDYPPPETCGCCGLPVDADQCNYREGRVTKQNRALILPTAKSGLLTGLVLSAGFLAGCTSTRIEPSLAPAAEPQVYSLASEMSAAAGGDVIALPEEVAVVPSSYAGPTPTSTGPQLAATTLKPAEEAVEVAALPAELSDDNPARDVFPEPPEARVPEEPSGQIVWAAPETPRGEVDRLIAKYAAYYEVPETLVRRVVKRESNFNPAARNRVYWGLMQIRHDTARGMGYQGSAQGLLDAETNLKYAVRYLRGAYLVADGNHDQAVRFYARGYYYDAKRLGMLEETGLGKDRKRRRQGSV